MYIYIIHMIERKRYRERERDRYKHRRNLRRAEQAAGSPGEDDARPEAVPGLAWAPEGGSEKGDPTKNMF